ncbi:MAG: RluA family pseudouridine synthase [Clostridium sp.]|jgi:23S rRNA pseudouridine1911/1915/1917 synthase|nr:RluA family pseudouridine synthase [Clostridium sp.]
MTESLNYITKSIPNHYVGLKVKTYIKDELELSSRFTRKAALEKRIKVNGRIVKLDYIFREGDELVVSLVRKETQDIDAENIPLDVVFEDEAILVINKAPFMIVHPTKNHEGGTLANAVTYHYRKNNEKTIVRLVSRLDMNTSGLMILAKNQFVHAKLSQSMKEDKYEKYYVALVKGNYPKDLSFIDLPIYRDGPGAFNRVVDKRGQESQTKVKVIDVKEGYSLLLLKLMTGRTHQIRVHLAHLGYPIVGDELYHGDIEIMNRQALHAIYLGLDHPVTDEVLHFYAKPKDDFIKVAKELHLDIDKLNKEALESMMDNF